MALIAPSWTPILQGLLALAMVFVIPFLGRREVRAMQRHTSGTARLSAYRSSILGNWTFLVLALALAYPVNVLVLPHDGAGALSWTDRDGMHVAALALLASLLLAYFGALLYYGATPASRSRVAPTLRRMRHLLPVAQRERRWFFAVSVSAGICEEVYMRGYLLQYLDGRLAGGMALGLAAAWLLSAVAFGFGHIYQGALGAFQATLAGLLLGGLAILTGNLFWPIVVHALGDLAALWIYRPLQDAPEDAARLIQGCDPEPGL